MTLLESGEMYLETIYVLLRESAYVRAVDVGDRMGFSKPSVSRAVSKLKADGYINVDEAGAITLTPSGKKTAKKIYERHTVLNDFLRAIGVGEECAAEDACKMEHDISDETFAAIKELLKKL